MRIGVDIDDVIVETMPAYLHAFEVRFGRSVPPAQASWDPFEHFPDIPLWERAAFFEYLRASRFMFTRPVLPDAPPAVRRLRAAGHTLVIVSGRPTAHLPETEAMLEGMGIRDCFAEIVHRGGEEIPAYKQRLARVRRLDVLVEDEHAAACAVAEGGVPVLLMDRPWNRRPVPPGVIRVATWAEAVDRLNAWAPPLPLLPETA